jgi:signal transduction histidine kinase
VCAWDAQSLSIAVRSILDWRRICVGSGTGLAIGLLLSPYWRTGVIGLFARTVGLGLALIVVFGILERWPVRLPSWLSRWALQVVGVAVATPVCLTILYVISTPRGAPPFWSVSDRLTGFLGLSGLGLLIAPWIAMVSLLRYINGEAENQALAFELERSELERRMLDSRLRLLHAQVEPHFLFNTLANVRELVETRSPHASAVLASLITYLRGAIPRLNASSMTLEDELTLVSAYLEVMHMRMPDRLTFRVQADAATRAVHCLPMVVLPLVENAIRHGIDPSEDGGTIIVQAATENGRCLVRVADTGAGLPEATSEFGTGLSNLLERLKLAYPGAASLQLLAQRPRGTIAELSFPAERAS